MSNLGSNRNSNGNNDSIVCQFCSIPGHGVHKCKNRFNIAFVPQKYYSISGRGGLVCAISNAMGVNVQVYKTSNILMSIQIVSIGIDVREIIICIPLVYSIIKNTTTL